MSPEACIWTSPADPTSSTSKWPGSSPSGASECHPTRIEPYGSIANLADPDGNLFDLCAYVS